MALPDVTTQDDVEYKANIDSTAADHEARIVDLETSGGIVLGTPQSPVSGTAVDFTNVPAWVKKITINFEDMEYNFSTGLYKLFLGDSGGFESSGYKGVMGTISGTNTCINQSFSSSFYLGNTNSISNFINGSVVLTLLDAATNTWAYAINMANRSVPHTYMGGGTKSLTAALDRLRIEGPLSGGAFVGGKINVAYE